MKKLLSLLMVTMLVVSLAVPAFAVDVKYSYNGLVAPALPEYDTETYPNAGIFYHGGDYILIVCKKPLQFSRTDADGKIYTGKTSYSWWTLTDGDWALNTADGYNSRSDGWWGTAADSMAIWTNTKIYFSGTTDIYLSGTEVVEALCDGSTCPATDVNEDGYCDDCGLRLMRMIAPPDGWPSNMPAPPTGFDSNSQYILMTKGDGYTYLYAFTPYDASPVSEWNTIGSVHNSMQLKMYDASGNGVNVKRLTYRLSDDGEWYQHDSQSVDSTLFGDFEEIDMIYSTLSFYKEDGTLFFPLPLWAEVEKVTQGEMMTTLAETLGTMKILMVCGVGCLALLVVLSLFGKRSLISRG